MFERNHRISPGQELEVCPSCWALPGECSCRAGFEDDGRLIPGVAIADELVSQAFLRDQKSADPRWRFTAPELQRLLGITYADGSSGGPQAGLARRLSRALNVMRLKGWLTCRFALQQVEVIFLLAALHPAGPSGETGDLLAKLMVHSSRKAAVKLRARAGKPLGALRAAIAGFLMDFITLLIR
jgi:hypothetical protein